MWEKELAAMNRHGFNTRSLSARMIRDQLRARGGFVTRLEAESAGYEMKDFMSVYSPLHGGLIGIRRDGYYSPAMLAQFTVIK